MADESHHGECQCCQYETDIRPYPRDERRVQHMDVWLCEVCASTPLSRAYESPDTFDVAALGVAIGWIANRLLDEIRRVAKPSEKTD